MAAATYQPGDLSNILTPKSSPDANTPGKALANTPGKLRTPSNVNTPGKSLANMHGKAKTPGNVNTPRKAKTPGYVNTPGKSLANTPGKAKTPGNVNTPGKAKTPGNVNTPGNALANTPGKAKTPGNVNTPGKALGNTPGNTNTPAGNQGDSTGKKRNRRSTRLLCLNDKKANLSDSIISADSGVDTPSNPGKGRKRKSEDGAAQQKKTDLKKFKDNDNKENADDDSSSEEDSDMEQPQVNQESNTPNIADMEDDSDDDESDESGDEGVNMNISSVDKKIVLEKEDSDDDDDESSDDDEESDDEEVVLNKSVNNKCTEDKADEDDDDDNDEDDDNDCDEEQTANVSNDDELSPPEGIIHESFAQKVAEKRKVKDDSNEDEPSNKKKKDEKETTPQHEEQVKPSEYRTIVVDNVPQRLMKEHMLELLFGCFGEIEYLRTRCLLDNDPTKPKVIVDIKREDFQPDRHQSQCFVKFKERRSAEKALAMNGLEMEGKTLSVEMAPRVHQSQAKSAAFYNISKDIEEEAILNHFKDCGEIESIRLMRNWKTGVSRGMGYINFMDADGVSLATKLHESELGGEKIRVVEHKVRPKMDPEQIRKSKKERKKKESRKRNQKKSQNKITPTNVEKNTLKAKQDTSSQQPTKNSGKPNVCSNEMATSGPEAKKVNKRKGKKWRERNQKKNQNKITPTNAEKNTLKAKQDTSTKNSGKPNVCSDETATSGSQAKKINIKKSKKWKIRKQKKNQNEITPTNAENNTN